MTPTNGVELEESLKTCEPGDTILLQRNTEYRGNFTVDKNNVTFRGLEGSKIVGVEESWALHVIGSDCILDGVTTTGGYGISVDGRRCQLTGLNIRLGYLQVSGEDNTVETAVVNGSSGYYGVVLRGSRNRFEGVRTQECTFGLHISAKVKECSFQNCLFNSSSPRGSWIGGGLGVTFVDVDFDSAVQIMEGEIRMERCVGRLLKLSANPAKVEQCECNFDVIEMF